jgi:hypothetical protein
LNTKLNQTYRPLPANVLWDMLYGVRNRRCDQQQVARSVLSLQHDTLVSPHEGSRVQQEAFFLPSMELITAVAQPTPDFTLSASTGQFREQAPHSMQASRSAISTFPLV